MCRRGLGPGGRQQDERDLRQHQPERFADEHGPATDLAAYFYETIGDQITFKEGIRSQPLQRDGHAEQLGVPDGQLERERLRHAAGSDVRQPITLKVYDPANLTTPLATSTKTFDVSYRPSASPKCTGPNAGKWMSPAKECKNGLAQDVTFGFSKVTLPATVVYSISYNTGGPADSLNVAITEGAAERWYEDGRRHLGRRSS